MPEARFPTRPYAGSLVSENKVNRPGPIELAPYVTDWGYRVSENPVHRKVVRAFVRSSSPLRIELPLYIGFPRMSSGTNWVSENALHRKPSFREDFF